MNENMSTSMSINMHMSIDIKFDINIKMPMNFNFNRELDPQQKRNRNLNHGIRIRFDLDLDLGFQLQLQLHPNHYFENRRASESEGGLGIHKIGFDDTKNMFPKNVTRLKVPNEISIDKLGLLQLLEQMVTRNSWAPTDARKRVHRLGGTLHFD